MTPLVTLAWPEPLPPDLGGAGAGGLAAAGHAQAVARLGHLGRLPRLAPGLRKRQELPLPLRAAGPKLA